MRFKDQFLLFHCSLAPRIPVSYVNAAKLLARMKPRQFVNLHKHSSVPHSPAISHSSRSQDAASVRATPRAPAKTGELSIELQATPPSRSTGHERSAGARGALTISFADRSPAHSRRASRDRSDSVASNASTGSGSSRAHLNAALAHFNAAAYCGLEVNSLWLHKLAQLNLPGCDGDIARLTADELLAARCCVAAASRRVKQAMFVRAEAAREASSLIVFQR